MKLLQWHQNLPSYIDEAIKKGELQVIKVKDKKFGEYEILQGEVLVGKTVIAFK